MSSVTATDPAATGTPPPSQGTLPSSTNYFYGFLIAFLIFLISFGGLHFIARRRRARLMREFALHGGDDGGVSVWQTEPVMWQPSYVGTKVPLWGNIMPLSSTLIQHDVIEEKAAPASPPRNPLAAFFGIPPMKPRRMDSNIVKVTEGMNIAIMINMPQAPGAPPAPEEDEIPPVCEIGMLQVPWTDADLPQTSC
ncbi:hypothetical protein B0H17DRAFT_1201022 [Mycena rosella]|uniref:Uncharacterized protein n=1 Tax=Mycena rosella TaxID=1033263 RepID=A0AAD7DH39_MYCRO|nr:hypothetical protein B0H17DRAFT_1201022 [Mycena rosella]